MYWAMMTLSTVGYGDYTAESRHPAISHDFLPLPPRVSLSAADSWDDCGRVPADIEKSFTNAVMCFGALVFAAITGSLASSMMAKKGAEQTYNTRMDEIYQFMRDKNVPTPVSRRTVAYFHTLWADKHVYNEVEILMAMPVCVSQSTAFCLVFPLLSRLRRRLCLVFPLLSRLRQRLSLRPFSLGLCVRPDHRAPVHGDAQRCTALRQAAQVGFSSPLLSPLQPTPSGANKTSFPRGVPMQHLAPRRNPECSNGHFNRSGWIVIVLFPRIRRG